MKKTMASVIWLTIALVLALPGQSSIAGTLGLTTGSPVISSSFAFIDYFESGPEGDLSTSFAEVDFTDGVSPAGFGEIGFGIGFSLANPSVGAAGGFDIFDFDGLFLAGDLLAVGFVEDVIELQFNNLSGSVSSSFGASVLALIAFDSPLGPNPFDSLIDGDFYTASVTISNVVTAVANVPEPSSLLLFLSALLGFSRVKRRRKLA